MLDFGRGPAGGKLTVFAFRKSWSAARSSILQVVISIQSLIVRPFIVFALRSVLTCRPQMVENPYYTEVRLPPLS